MFFGAYTLIGDSVNFDAQQQAINQRMFEEEIGGVDESIKALSSLKTELIFLYNNVKEGDIVLINNLNSDSKIESSIGIFDKFFPIIKGPTDEGRPAQQYSKNSIEVYFKRETHKFFYKDHEKEGKIRFIKGTGIGVVNYKSILSNKEEEINKMLAEYGATIFFVHNK